MADKPTVSSGPWPLGIDNRSPDYAVPAEALRNAVNVDLGRDGRVRRRQGYARIVEVVAPHSLYSCPVGTFFASQGTLYALNADNTTTALLSGVIGKPLAFAYANGDVYLSDGLITKKLVGGITVSDWGIAAPTSAPVLSATTGTLAPGTFTAAISFVATSGEESGVSALATLSINSTGGIQFSQLPSSAAASVTTLRLYLSTPGGLVLYHVADVAIGTTTYSVTAIPGTGKEADLIPYSAPPPCRIIRHKHGRLYCAANSVVWFTEPFAFGRVKTAANFWQFPAEITVMEAADAGLYVVADKTYFLRFKDPAEAQLEEVLQYGAIPYSSIVLPDNTGFMWQSSRGAVMAEQTGTVKNMQEKMVATEDAAFGAALLREKDGLKQFIAVLSETRANTLMASDFMEAEIIRKGV